MASQKQDHVPVDEFDCVASLRKLEEIWLDFYSYTIDFAAANLSFISQHQENAFISLPEDA